MRKNTRKKMISLIGFMIQVSVMCIMFVIFKDIFEVEGIIISILLLFIVDVIIYENER